MKLISWNVNGIRACVKKGFVEFFKGVDAEGRVITLEYDNFYCEVLGFDHRPVELIV